MDLRAEEISQILKDQIANYSSRVEVAETGTIVVDRVEFAARGPL